jgi:hypothetical protein
MRDLIFTRNITTYSDRLNALPEQLITRFLSGMRVDVGYDDFASFPSQRRHCGSPNTAPRSCDYRDTSFDTHFHQYISFFRPYP